MLPQNGRRLASSGPSSSFLNRLVEHEHLRPDTWYLIASATSTTLGKPRDWIPAVYQRAVEPLGPAPTNPPASPIDFSLDLPRRKVVRRMKEALVKCVILSGVPHSMQASLALRDALEPGDSDSSFVRKGLDFGEESERRGTKAAYRVYRDPLPLSGEIGEAMKDLQWLSINITYGALLSPISEESSVAPLTQAETEIVVLSCLIAQRCGQESAWHLRGCLRSGLSETDVEAVQQAIEMVGEECGVDLKTGMPRVNDVQSQSSE